MPHLVSDHLLTLDAWEAYFKAQPERRVKEESSLIWGEVKNALAGQIHEVSAYCQG